MTIAGTAAITDSPSSFLLLLPLSFCFHFLLHSVLFLLCHLLCVIPFPSSSSSFCSPSYPPPSSSSLSPLSLFPPLPQSSTTTTTVSLQLKWLPCTLLRHCDSRFLVLLFLLWAHYLSFCLTPSFHPSPGGLSLTYSCHEMGSLPKTSANFRWYFQHRHFRSSTSEFYTKLFFHTVCIWVSLGHLTHILTGFGLLTSPYRSSPDVSSSGNGPVAVMSWQLSNDSLKLMFSPHQHSSAHQLRWSLLCKLHWPVPITHLIPQDCLLCH